MPNELDFNELTVYDEHGVARGIDLTSVDHPDFTNNFVGPLRSRNDLQYPMDLGDVNLNHFVLFSIYESEGFKLEKVTRAITDFAKFKGTEAFAAIAGPPDNFVQPEKISQARLDSLEVQAGTSLNDAAESLKNLTENEKILHITRVKAPLRRSIDTVAMYMPEKIQVAYGLQYEQESLATAGTIRNFFNLFNSGGDKSAIISELIEDIGVNTISKLVDSAAGVVGLNPNIGAAIEAKTHKVRNPHMEVLFKAVNNRTFDFNFSFKPRSREESLMVQEIIKTFKKHSHPTVSTAQKFLTHPSEFEITYFSNRTENRFLNRIARCVLTNMTVDYSASGVFSTFEHDESLANRGAAGSPPTHINISLSFMEVINIDKDFIEAGY